MSHLLRAFALVALAFPLPAFAAPEAGALLTQIHGAVLVDTGKGFSAVSEDVRLKLGDRVMVAKEGGAILSYGADCNLPLEAPSVTLVQETACTTGTQGNQGGQSTGGAAVTALTVLGPLGLLGAAAFDNDDESPVSP